MKVCPFGLHIVRLDSSGFLLAIGDHGLWLLIDVCLVLGDFTSSDHWRRGCLLFLVSTGREGKQHC